MKTRIAEFPQRSLTLHYLDQGDGPLTLFFMHGWCIDLSYWEAQIHFFQRKYRVVAVDLPGFGDSKVERTGWSIESIATDLLQLMEQLDLQNVVIVGHSMSGELGMETALQAGSRVIGLVGVDNFKFVDMEMPQPVQDQFSTFLQGFHTDFARTAPAFADAFFFHPETSEEVRERIRTAYGTSDPSIAVPIFMALLQYGAQVNARLAQLPFPLHIIGNDTPAPHEPGLQVHCGHGYRLSFIPGTGHYPMIEKPNEFNRALEAVLSGME